MTLPLKAGSRPWHRFYPEGVRADFAPEDITWTRMMVAAFDAHADRPMLEYGGQWFSYGEIRARAARVAAALRAHGIQKGDRVALHLPNCPWHPVFFFGVMAAGAAVTHLSPLDADREIAHKLHDSGAKLVITLTTPEFARHYQHLLASGETPPLVQCPDPVSAAGRDCPVLDGAIGVEAFWAGHEGAAFDPVPVTPSDIALLQYTGGTTGVPKAAVLTHRCIAASVQMYREFLKGDPISELGRSSLLYSPLFHIMGLVTVLLRCTCEGGILHLRQRFTPEQALDDIETYRINALSGVPTIWIAMLQTPGIDKRDLSSLIYIGSGGAPLPVEIYNRVRQLTGLKLRGGWGMTETSPAGTNVPRDMPDEKLGTIGIPLPGHDVKIVDVDDPGRALPPGQQGEIAVMGRNVLDRYWNKPEETAAAFHDGWFLTGDIGYMDNDGFFFLVDRKKDMILSGGFNVYPLVIENAVHLHSDVAEAMAIGVPDEYRGESAKVFVVLNPGAEPFTLEELQAFLEDKLGRHEIPRFLEFRTALPYTPVGKQDRKALKAEEMAKRAEVAG